MTASEHIWQSTGVSGEHAKIGRQVFVFYVKCATCGQMGFRRGMSRVIYTWKRFDGE